MRRNWLASAALTVAALSVPVAGITGTAHAATRASGQQTAIGHTAVKRTSARRHHRRRRTFNQRAAAFAKTLVGDRYVYGGTTPSGFDCSGLTQYVYRHFGKRIRRIAEGQFRQFRRISHHHARPGDLVFFHETSNPRSYVYHVGVYEGGHMMVAAATYGQGVVYQNFGWAGDTVTFGTITH